MEQRRIIIAACDEVTPGDLHGSADERARFEQMTRGNYPDDGRSSSCGYLLSYALWRAGCRSPEILNIDDPDYGLAYEIGANISRPVSGAKEIGAWRTFADTPEGPRPGDAIYYNQNGDHEHVNILRDRLTVNGVEHWYTSDGGHPTRSSSTQVVVRTRSGDDLQFADRSRRIVGWIDADSLDWVAVPEVNEPNGGGSGILLGVVGGLCVLAFVDGWIG